MAGYSRSGLESLMRRLLPQVSKYLLDDVPMREIIPSLSEKYVSAAELSAHSNPERAARRARDVSRDIKLLAQSTNRENVHDDVDAFVSLAQPQVSERIHSILVNDAVSETVKKLDAELRAAPGSVGGIVASAPTLQAGVCDVGTIKPFMQQRSAMARALGYNVVAKMSTVPGAGRGLFLNGGDVKQGAVLALYPGVVYLLERVLSLQSVLQSARDDGFEDNEYLVSAFDGTITDARPFLALQMATTKSAATPHAWAFVTENNELHTCIRWPSFHRRGSSSQSLDNTEGALDVNPVSALAYAHFANHPPTGTAPNAVLCHTQVRFQELVQASAASRSGVTPHPEVMLALGDHEGEVARLMHALLPERLHKYLRLYEPPTVPYRLRNMIPTTYCDANLDSEGSYEPDVALPLAVLVASRDLRDGEELFFDYRMDDEYELPPWYSKVVEEEVSEAPM
ncbi:SET domain-containing protein [Pseudoscourfieldia marina]